MVVHTCNPSRVGGWNRIVLESPRPASWVSVRLPCGSMVIVRRQRQEDQVFKGSLGYMRLTWNQREKLRCNSMAEHIPSLHKP